jgi:hypothetical protein
MVQKLAEYLRSGYAVEITEDGWVDVHLVILAGKRHAVMRIGRSRRTQESMAA